MLGPLAPTPAAREQAQPPARASLDPTAAPRSNAYTAGKIERTTSNWVPQHRSGDAAIAESWWLLTARARDLVRNEPALGAARQALVDHCIGEGLVTSALALVPDTDGEPDLDEEFNAEADELWDYWCEHEADAEGKLSFGDQQRLAFGETSEAGEVLLLRCMENDPERLIPLAYQIVEGEQIDSNVDRPQPRDGNMVVRGVELDRRRRPVAYYLFGAHPYDTHGTFTSTSERVPAERLIHYYVPFRPSQSRGISWFTAAVRTARDRDFLLGNVLTSAAIQAIFTVVRKSAFPNAGLGLADDADTSDAHGNPLTKLGTALVANIGQNDAIETIQPSHPSANLSPFVDLILRETAMAARMSTLRLTRDYSKTNFSSAKAAHAQDEATFRPLSRDFARRVVLPVRREFMAMAAALGRLRSVSATQFRAQRRRWQRLEVILPGRGYIDDETEINAATKRMRSGITSLSEEIAAYSGKRLRNVVLQRKRDAAFCARHGVENDWSAGGAQPIPRGGARDEAPVKEAADA